MRILSHAIARVDQVGRRLSSHKQPSALANVERGIPVTVQEIGAAILVVANAQPSDLPRPRHLSKPILHLP